MALPNTSVQNITSDTMLSTSKPKIKDNFDDLLENDVYLEDRITQAITDLSTGDLDSRYYTETEVTTLLNNHNVSSAHDGRYYTKSQVDNIVISVPDSYYNAQSEGLTGDGTTDDSTELQTLLTTIGSDPSDIFFPSGTYKLATNITIPSNITLRFANGAILKRTSSAVITLNCGIDAGLYQIFDDDGTGSWSGSPKVSEVYPEWFGSDATSITKAISFISNTSSVTVLELTGTYNCTTTQFTLPSDIELRGTVNCLISSTLTAGNAIFTATQKENIIIKNVNFESTNDGVIAFLAKTCTNVLVEWCNNTNTTIIETNTYLTINRFDGTSDPSATGGYVSEDFGCKDVRVLNNNTTTDGIVGAAINIQFSSDVIVTGNVINGYRHGIEYWGGDSYYDRGGIITNPRWARRIKINNNIVSNVDMGGIWGSMGEDIHIYDNDVQNCKDVGVDFEGTINGVAKGNIIKNCSLGCLASFFYNKNLKFVNNICSLDGVWTKKDSSDIAVRLYFHSNGTNNTTDGSFNIKLINNKFNFLGTDGTLGEITLTNSKKITFKGNELYNTNVNQVNANGGNRKIVDNFLHFDVVADSAFSAINIRSTHSGYNEHPSCIIERNEIISSVSQPSGSYGIYSMEDYFDAPLHHEINDNKVQGFTDSIAVIDNQSNAGITHTFNIRRNIVSGNIVNLTTKYPNKGAWFLEFNRTFDNVSIPNATPTSSTWKYLLGQKIELTPTPNGSIGSVCTTAGYANSTAWAGTTAYNIGDRVNANNKVYYCTVGGTSSSTAPSHSSGTATDGTVTWAYVGALAVFKDYGTIAS